MLNAETEGKNLLKLAHRILKENSIPNRLDGKELGQCLLYMMQSRADRNILQHELDSIENSGSVQGFFTESSSAKTLFKLILEHLVFCVKRKACQQKDAEHLLAQCVINFKATAFEQNFISGFLNDALKRAIQGETPRASDVTDLGKDTKESNDVQKKKEDGLFNSGKSLNADQETFASQQQRMQMRSRGSLKRNTSK